MKTFHCGNCGQLVFFENVRCERCEAPLGYLPEVGEVGAFEIDASSGQWRSLHPSVAGQLYRPCHNYSVENVCNWMVPADSPASYCESCSLTETIPDLSNPDNRPLWYRTEAAKRRLVYTLTMLGLPVESRLLAPERGMSFAFKAATESEPVMTGHANGLITLNLAEADDAERERVRAAMHEPYRTLVGHFRHEIGHYYFDRLIVGSAWQEAFRERFGDERADYQAALDAHYQNGAPAGWEDSYISEYASMHPWEDWAETWAHYLHMVDTLDTANACGLVLDPDDDSLPHLDDQTSVDEASFGNLMRRWFPLTYALNSLNRSMGVADAYPFALSPAVVAKLRFVHRVISATREAAPDEASGARAAGSEEARDEAAGKPGGSTS
ncbi:zinc-binding metallopeptidase family protein [Burkholderia gladioli]|uniref:zinc-binding metallopeptidase family protein n=1 Tax=Burkholderia gladioli TaxID=28095 RepID=UPI00163F4B85|nr:putative zinc-binding metallopeptidase [Burkholderia gladioli]MBU9196748.1 putative zinc-binding metallopeptidase [Burkholderia gladioli]MBU9212940.1 putative zinc-binding metallopeptidase [Burkholderia gladioli]MDN7722175.1 putative zinc-binding metallopeptidase [Burkholderia gladioli]